MKDTHLDPTARSVWVDIYRLDTTVTFTRYTADGIERRAVDITPEFVATMIDSFETLKSAGDRVTVLKEHNVDGEHYGTVHELRVKDGWLQARCSFVPSIWEAYDDQRVVEFSPAFVDVLHDPHTGAKYRNVLIEVTITSMALQHTLRPPQATNPGSALLGLIARGALTIGADEMTNKDDEEVTPAEEEAPEEAAVEGEEETEETELSRAMAQIEELTAALAAANDKLAELEGTEAKAASLEIRVNELEDNIVGRDLLNAGFVKDELAHLIELRRANRPLFDKHVELHARDRQTPIGVPGDAPTSSTMSASAILAEAEKAGVSYGGGKFTKWLSDNYPHQLADVLSLVRN